VTQTTNPALTRIRHGAVLLGPAYVAAVAYLDPGNVATNVGAGVRYGYLLVWVVVGANLLAALVQYLSAKLGLVTGMSLPEALRDRMPLPARLAYWIQAELVVIATDLAEVVGGAIALYLLFGIPLPVGGVLTGGVSLLLLAIRDHGGQRRFERAVTWLVAVIAVGFLAGLVIDPAPAGDVTGGLVPRFTDAGSVLFAAGILGATVMPHAVYVHSALARDRHGRPDPGRPRRRLLIATRFDVGTAMLLAGAVNLGLLLVAANSLRGVAGDVETIEDAHAAIGTAFGGGVALLFAVGLLASGLASTSVGCYAGDVVMRGLLRRRVPLILRRLVALIPAVAVLAGGLDATLALVLSQVILSFGIPFAMVPLVALTARRDLMGSDANHPVTTTLAAVIATAVIGLNLVLVYLTFFTDLAVV
jgi:manganese transport protein